LRSSLSLLLVGSLPLTTGCGLGAAILDALDSPSSSDTGVFATDDTGFGSGPDSGLDTAPDTGLDGMVDDLAVSVSGLTVPDPGQIAEAVASYDLSWEGEVLQGGADVEVAVVGTTLYAYLEVIEQRIGEERVVSLSLELPADEVEAGATLQATLYYGESPVQPDWLDVLLGGPVTVEVADDPDAAGALSLSVAEAPLEPMLGVGVMRAGLLYEGPYDVSVASSPAHDCATLTVDQLAFVEQTLEELATADNEVFDGADGYAYLARGGQGGDPMQPFILSADLVDHLTSWNGSYAPQRVADSGGLLTLDFLPPAVAAPGSLGAYAPMDERQDAGLYEVGRRLTIDGRTWGPGFGLVVERFYADTPDAHTDEAVCVTVHEGALETFGM